jgi:hypothetical protein
MKESVKLTLKISATTVTTEIVPYPSYLKRDNGYFKELVIEKLSYFNIKIQQNSHMLSSLSA